MEKIRIVFMPPQHLIMKLLRHLFAFGSIGLIVATTSAADLKDQLAAAAKQLGEKSNYSWITTTRESDGRGGPLGPIDGKTEKEGVTWLSFVVGGLPIEVFMQGQKGTAKALEGWQTFDEVARMGATPGAVIRYLRTYKTPASETAVLGGKAKDFKPMEDAVVGDLPEEAVKEMLLIGARRREGQEPQATDAKGTIKYWLKDGALTKYEINVQGKVTSGDRESTINRTMKTEIKDVGATKLDIPEEAKPKMI
jgi:hypothetical protein